MNYLYHIQIMISLYTVLAMSLNLVLGYAGLLSLCHAAFFGIGAYTTTLLMIHTGWEFIPAILMAAVLTGLLSTVIGVSSLRLKGDFFILATLGFQVIVFSVLYNWTGLTQGSYGIPGIPVPVLFGIRFDTVFRYFLLATITAILCGGLIYAFVESPFGRVLKALREDETAAQALGKNVASFKVTAFTIAAIFAAIAGGLFAGYMRYIDPTSFTVTESIFMLSIVIIGGAGSLSGPVIGAILLVTLPEVLRFLHIPDANAANLRQIIYGLLLIILMRFRPQGIRGEYGFN